MLGQSESSSILPNHDKTGVGDRLVPAQNQPHVAFQTPLFECNGGGLSPERQPFSLSFPRVMETSRYRIHCYLLSLFLCLVVGNIFAMKGLLTRRDAHPD